MTAFSNTYIVFCYLHWRLLKLSISLRGYLNDSFGSDLKVPPHIVRSSPQSPYGRNARNLNERYLTLESLSALLITRGTQKETKIIGHNSNRRLRGSSTICWNCSYILIDIFFEIGIHITQLRKTPNLQSIACCQFSPTKFKVCPNIKPF